MPYSDDSQNREYKRQWYLRNKERQRKLRRKNYVEHREEYLHRASVQRLSSEYYARRRELYKSRRSALIEKTRLWRKNNPEKAKALSSLCGALYRARKRNAKGVCSSSQLLLKVLYHGWKCLYCRKELTAKTLTIDHRIPLSKGGSNWPSNLAPACKKCNCSKSDKIIKGK